MIYVYVKSFPLTHENFGIHVNGKIVDLVRHSPVMASGLFSDHPIYRYKYYRADESHGFYYRKVVTMPTEWHLDLLLLEYGSILSDKSKWVDLRYY